MSPEAGLVVVLGSCSVDYICYAERLPVPGETLHGYKFATSFGGKGANQCVAVAKLGGKAAMIAKVGDDSWGVQYRRKFNGLGIDTTHMSSSKDTLTGTAHINVGKTGENQIVIVPSANNLLSTEFVGKAVDVIEKAAVLVCQLETPLEATLQAFRICKGIKILNAAPGVSNLSKELLSLTTILCVNETEAEIITGQSLDKFGIKPMLKELLNTGCKIAILTLGSKGAAFLSKDDSEAVHVFCEQIQPVDTTVKQLHSYVSNIYYVFMDVRIDLNTGSGSKLGKGFHDGAGDVFIGAIATLLSYKEQSSFVKLIGAACKVATISVTLEGTQESYPTMDIRSFISVNYECIKL